MDPRSPAPTTDLPHGPTQVTFTSVTDFLHVLSNAATDVRNGEVHIAYTEEVPADGSPLRHTRIVAYAHIGTAVAVLDIDGGTLLGRSSDHDAAMPDNRQIIDDNAARIAALTRGCRAAGLAPHMLRQPPAVA